MEGGRSRFGFLPVAFGVGVFFIFQFLLGLKKLSGGSGSMKNKFSALAQDKYLDFLILQNLYVAGGYFILVILFAFFLYPYVSRIRGNDLARPRMTVFVLGFLGSVLVHVFFTLRLVMTRPYFLDEAKFGYWYYEILNVLPDAAKPSVFLVIFKILPLVALGYVGFWYLSRLGAKLRMVAVSAVVLIGVTVVWQRGVFPMRKVLEAAEENERKWNVLIIGSDSLRGDRLGCNGYRPRRTDGLAAAGVSPNIDALARRSVNFKNCFTPLASTLESGTSLMVSQYPHTHGFRHMYPSEERVEKTKASITPIAELLAGKGYDTAAIGDWCAGYYELMPLGFEHVAVSSFDNFKIYMSQAVVMAHFVIPLYFDHPIGYEIFPQLGSFAQFVTPKVVTDRVTKRLSRVANSKAPFFWHVFYSCNHLPYRNPEPYSSMFTDPDYSGPNKNGVDFDIDAFIGGTDLENKWLALPEKEVTQIRDLYDGCTRLFDDNVGEILEALEQNGLAENTIVIITGDHGDNLYEEGVTLGHGLTFNGGLQANQVPLVFHLPGYDANEIEEQVSILDIAPTVADLLGVEKPGNWEGRSFAKWLDLEEEPSSRAFYGETGFPFIQFRVEGVERPPLPPMDEMTFIEDSFNYQFVLKEEFEEPLVAAKQRCLMTEKWKLICTPTRDGGRHFGLYLRGSAEFERGNLASEHPEVFSAMKKALQRWMDDRVETPRDAIFPDGE